MINTLEQLNDMGWFSVVVILILTATFTVSAIELWGKLKVSLGLKSKSSIHQEEIEQELSNLKNAVKEQRVNLEKYQEDIFNRQTQYHEQSISIRNNLAENQVALKDSIDELKFMLIKKDIDDKRWEILSFASGVMNGMNYNKEQYDRVMETYDDYERILTENNMENGKADISMEFIREKYKELLETGFN